jgi:hypothetical protein
LRDASETARYLSLYRIGAQREPQWIDRPAPEYFLPEDAKSMVEDGLTILRRELNIEMNGSDIEPDGTIQLN